MVDRSHIEGPETMVRADDVRSRLARTVRRALHGGGDGAASEQIVRVAVPVAPVDPFAWLRAQQAGEKIYWSGRGDGAEVAAVGVADRHAAAAPDGLDALEDDLLPLLATNCTARYYGGLRFDPAQAAEGAWQAFGAYHFVLPRFELRVERGEVMLACNLVLPHDLGRREAILQQIHALAFPLQPLEGALPLPILRTDAPDRDGWRRNIAWALNAFSKEKLGKVVLARRAVFGFAENLDPLLLLKRLAAATPGCFHFGFQPEPGLTFVGASPERLVRRDGRRVQSEAVAGTRPRGATAHDDDRLRDELLHSEKDQREHAFVRRSIKETLGPLCETLQVETITGDMKLAHGRHLRSGIDGTLREGVTHFDLLCALHPTPAVGGYPTPEALEAIRRLEPFDRGWYAGPVGWLGADAAEFAVGIRTGLVAPRRLALFSGAGIVEGSVPEAEWDEIEQKIADFVEVLGLEAARTVAPATNGHR